MFEKLGALNVTDPFTVMSIELPPTNVMGWNANASGAPGKSEIMKASTK